MLRPEDNRREAAAAAPVARRLLIRPGAIGDTIVWLPAAERWLAPETEIWVPATNIPLVRHLGPARSIQGTGLDLFGLDGVEPPPAILDHFSRFDEIVTWYGTNRDDFKRAALRTGKPFRFLPALPPTGWPLHATDFYLDQVNAPHGGVPRLPVARRSEGVAVIHPFSGSPRKNWPLDRFRRCAAALEAQGVTVRWCSGPEERLDGSTVFESLDGLMQWLARTGLFIGNDSGISHLAAACAVPVIALFGPTDPRVWAPRAPHARVVSFETEPSQVAAAALRLWLEADRAHDHGEPA